MAAFAGSDGGADAACAGPGACVGVAGAAAASDAAAAAATTAALLWPTITACLLSLDMLCPMGLLLLALVARLTSSRVLLPDLVLM